MKKVIAKPNTISAKNISKGSILVRQLKNPLLVILIFATLLSFLLGETINSIVIGAMMVLSVVLGFWNEYQAQRTVADLLSKISLTATVIRGKTKIVVPVESLVVGDVVALYPGSVIPADIRISDSQHLEINESILTGESFPVAKGHKDCEVYMGTSVVSGSGQGEIVAVGNDTKLGKMSQEVASARPITEFEKGLRQFGTLLIKIISVMGLVIFVGNIALGRPLVGSALFALTIAIGLTPELLPVVVTVSLSWGARQLAKKKVIIKQLDAIEDLGNMEVLCTDKTGTLTEGDIVLDEYVDASGTSDERIIRLSMLCNSAVINGDKVVGDAIDTAIAKHVIKHDVALEKGYTKIYERPFDYEKRYMYSVVKKGKLTTVYVKGSASGVIDRCDLTPAQKDKWLKHFDAISKRGIRAVVVASKAVKDPSVSSYEAITKLDFEGYLTFRDIPKKGVDQALALLSSLDVKLKVVTGDNENVAATICREIGANYANILTGPELDKMTNDELSQQVWSIDIFARVTPTQKSRILRALNTGNHTIGYLGDGVNDALALHEADVGISVESAVDVAKDTASIVLLEKDLSVIAEGIKDGRKTFSNTIKYILMGTSSNFGNMFSAAGASFIFKFLPMLPAQVLLTNFLYDVSQISIPTDNVDEGELRRPKGWDMNKIKKYMFFFGPISSLFDFATFAIMYFVFGARNELFQTGWFIESLTTQTLVIFVIRTAKSPFFKSRPSRMLVATMLSVVAIGIVIPYLPIGKLFSFVPLPPVYFLFLITMTVVYLILVEIGKVYLNTKILKAQTS